MYLLDSLTALSFCDDIMATEEGQRTGAVLIERTYRAFLSTRRSAEDAVLGLIDHAGRDALRAPFAGRPTTDASSGTPAPPSSSP